MNPEPSTQIPGTPLKACTQCCLTKPVTEFYTDKRQKSGRSPSCKRCHHERRKANLTPERRAANNAAARRRYANRTEEQDARIRDQADKRRANRTAARINEDRERAARYYEEVERPKRHRRWLDNLTDTQLSELKRYGHVLCNHETDHLLKHGTLPPREWYEARAKRAGERA